MPSKIVQKINSLKQKLLEDEERIRLQFFAVYIGFAVISAFMALINSLTGYRGGLMWATIIFSLVNLVNVGLAIIRHKLDIVARVLFSVEIIALFTFFIITGDPEGFSVNWALILPLGGMVLYRRKIGTLMSTIQFAIFIFFFWFPVGRGLLQYEYAEQFMIRFPIIYVACFCVGFFFESLRSIIHREMVKSRDNYRSLTYVDPQTHLGNEHQYIKCMQELENDIENGIAEFGLVVLDINNLKRTNDIYGHRYGSHLIVEAGRILPSIFVGCQICHVGGDEFVIFVKSNMIDCLENMFATFEEELSYRHTVFDETDLILSIAGGFAVYKQGDTYKDTFQKADKAMYANKERIKKSLLTKFENQKEN